jgi:hypothetical protein
LYANTTGYHNTALGAQSLTANTTGTTNTAIGLQALYANTSGSNNIAVGGGAGSSLTSGSSNIDIGNSGVGGESGVIRLGAAGSQTATYIAGIGSAHVTGSAVYVTSSGQLGVLASSERYKEAVAPIGTASGKLQKLRPVTFRLRTDPQHTLQYGLIAEEVAEVYPELVIRDETGRIEGVRYEELAPMLLNEEKRQKHQIDVQATQLRVLQHDLAQMQELNRAMHVAVNDLQKQAGSAGQR